MTGPAPDHELAPWREMTPEDVWAELSRARESEQRLADALEAHANRLTTNYTSDPGYHEIILSNAERRKMLDVLKKAGRNP